MPAAKRKGAGALSERVIFMEPVEGTSQYGGVVTGYVDRFEEACRLVPRSGSEPYMASRLQGIQPYSLIVYSSTRTRGVSTAWRARNRRTGKTYNITAITNPDERNQLLELMVTEGQAG